MTILYVIWQCTWGSFQTLLGLFLLLLHHRDRHFCYHGAVVTVWRHSASVSLGLFVFVTDAPAFAPQDRGQMAVSDPAEMLLVHEYGHTIQSLILGPLYLLVIGVPSALWANLPSLVKKRSRQKLSYFSFYTERWANRLGERVTRPKAP